MARSSEIDLDEARLKLLQVKLGRLFDWQKPAIVQSVGPFNPEVFEDFEQKRQSLVSQCSTRLLEYSDIEIQILATKDKADSQELRAEWRSFAERETSFLSRTTPPWYAGGLGHPDHVADFEYWCKMPSFSIEEVLCLTVGVSPDSFPAERLERISKADKREIPPALRFLVDRHQQLARQFSVVRHMASVFPTEFLAWADRTEFEVHPEFVRLLRRYLEGQEGRATADVVSARSDKPDVREIDSIAKLLTAIAIDAYGYRPTDKRSPFPKELSDICASTGISISEDTVRKYLHRGASFLPDDREPE